MRGADATDPVLSDQPNEIKIIYLRINSSPFKDKTRATDARRDKIDKGLLLSSLQMTLPAILPDETLFPKENNKEIRITMSFFLPENRKESKNENGDVRM